MPRNIKPDIMRFLLWDTSASAPAGTWEWFRAKWRVFGAIVGSALLTWVEWVEHHPPEIAIIAVIHFLFVLVAIALLYQIVRWLFVRS